MQHTSLKSEVLNIISNNCYQYNKNKPFELSSGNVSNEYIDCKAVFSNHFYLRDIIKIISSYISFNTDIIAGMGFGAAPLVIGSALMFNTSRPLHWFLIRPEQKKHGMQKQIEANNIAGKNICIIDDVLTTGKSIITAVNICKQYNANIGQIVVLVDRQEGGVENIINHTGITNIGACFNIQDIRANIMKAACI